MPRQDRVGLHQEDRPAVTTECTRERGEDRSVVGFEARTSDLALQHGELMAQHEDLDILGTIRAAAQHQQVDHEPDETVETGHALILAVLESRRSANAKHQVNAPDEFSAPTGHTSYPNGRSGRARYALSASRGPATPVFGPPALTIYPAEPQPTWVF